VVESCVLFAVCNHRNILKGQGLDPAGGDWTAAHDRAIIEP
jgi:hypothetical protein